MWKGDSALHCLERYPASTNVLLLPRSCYSSLRTDTSRGQVLSSISMFLI